MTSMFGSLAALSTISVFIQPRLYAALCPLCALLMALYIYDAFPLFDEDIDKAKRKEKNTLALEEAHEVEGEMLMGEDRLLEAQQR